MPTRRAANRRGIRPLDVFINVPYDAEYEPLYLALIAGLCGWGLNPRATLEIPSSERRLDRIRTLLKRCRYSFHDLSRVESPNSEPRFNMPFELGLATEFGLESGQHEIFIFEAVRYRLQRTLSDLNGTDPMVHQSRPEELLMNVIDVLSTGRRERSLNQLRFVHRSVLRTARDIRDRGASLFSARAFTELRHSAREAARERSVTLEPGQRTSITFAVAFTSTPRIDVWGAPKAHFHVDDVTTTGFSITHRGTTKRPLHLQIVAEQRKPQ